MQGYIVAIMHGGYCCGITHLYNFPAYPTFSCQARTHLAGMALSEYHRGSPYTTRHYNDSRPVETAEQRLRAMVQLICDTNYIPGSTYASRPSGIIEVVLTSHGGIGVAENWRALLTDLGFVQVNEHRNSNSGKTLHVFHKNTGA